MFQLVGTRVHDTKKPMPPQGSLTAAQVEAKQLQAPHAAALLAMVAQRLDRPGSKLACHERWLERVWLPEARDLFRSAISESGGGERVLTMAQAAEVAGSYGDLWRKTAAAPPAGGPTAQSVLTSMGFRQERGDQKSEKLKFPALRLVTPVSVATKATPQASCSWRPS